MIDNLDLDLVPTWIRSFFVLSVVYLAYLLWSCLIRTRRELHAASWILDERRKAGIPDSDKRPFKIAKAAVEAKRSIPTSQATQSNSSNQQPANLSPPLSTNTTTEPPSKCTRLTPSQPPSQRSIASTSRTPLTQTPTTPSDPTRQSRLPQIKSHSKLDSSSNHPTKRSTQSLLTDRSSKQKRVASTSIDSKNSNESSSDPDKLDSRNRKKAKTRNELSSKRSATSSDKEDHGGSTMTRKRSKASVPGHLTQDYPQDDRSDHTNRRKKRILSDCTSEVDADHFTRTKKGRSEQQVSPTDSEEADDQNLMQVDKDEEPEVGSDDDLYMIAGDGQKKKLVKIRSDTPSSEQSQDQDTVEKRWVTRQEFRRLKQRGMLLVATERWAAGSRPSSDTGNSTLPSPSSISNTRTPSKQTPSVEVEHGPIWNIEGKPSCSRTTTKMASNQLRSASRPRNSLGRMRLSLPPGTVSPIIPRPRSQLLSLLAGSRYLDDTKDSDGNDGDGDDDDDDNDDVIATRSKTDVDGSRKALLNSFHRSTSTATSNQGS